MFKYVNLMFLFIFFSQFQTVLAEDGDLFSVVIDGKIGFIDINGTIVIDPIYDNSSKFSEGLAVVLLDENIYVINNSGELLSEVAIPAYGVEAKQFGLRRFVDGYAAIKSPRHSVSFYIDKRGSILKNRIFENVWSFSDQRGAIKLDGKWGFIDLEGEDVVSNTFDLVMPFSEGIAHVKLGNMWGFIDLEGRYTVPPKYKLTSGKQSDGISIVTNGIKLQYVDRLGRQKFNITCKRGYDFSEGLAPVKDQSNLFGFINKKGEFVIKPQFQDVASFSEGRAAVKINDKWGFIDNSGTLVIEPNYYNFGYFENGLALVWLDVETRCYINKKGKKIYTYSLLSKANLSTKK